MAVQLSDGNGELCVNAQQAKKIDYYF